MRQYVPELDGLRAVAVVAVALFHAAPWGPVGGGFIGVDLFFVLSAFLITSILADEIERSGRIDLLRFYVRRFLRLMPALLLMLAGYVVIAPFIWPGHGHGLDAMLAGLYLTDYSYPFTGRPEFLNHTWSLAVEEQFYLIFPWLLVPLLKSKHRIAWLVCAYVAMTIWRLSFDINDWRSYYYRADTHGTGLILGVLLYFVRPKLGMASGIAGLGLFAFISAFSFIDIAGAWILPSEIVAAMVICAALSGTLPALAHPALVHIGKLSYAIYLWHYPIAHAVRYKFDFPTSAAITLGASYALALLSFYTVEAWGRRMKNLGNRVEARGIA